MENALLYQSLKREMLKCREDAHMNRVSVGTSEKVFEAYLEHLCSEHDPEEVCAAFDRLNTDMWIMDIMTWLAQAGPVGHIIICLIAKHFGAVRINQACILAEELDELDLRLYNNLEGDV